MARRVLFFAHRGGQVMTMVNMIAYAVVFGLPFLLVSEEIVHRLVPCRESHAAARTGRERRAPEAARTHAA
jgi:hypothetical protein